jgi:hypothetical protein
LLVLLPILSGVRLRMAGGPDDVAAANMLVDFAGPGLAILAFAVGAGARFSLPRECRHDPAALRKASSLRMFGLLIATTIGLRLVFPFDLITPSGPWRRMVAWAIGVALPLWAAGMYALVRGRSSMLAAIAALGFGTAPVAIALAWGTLYALPIGALLMPAAAAGLVAGGGAALAAWYGVAARGWVVLTTITAVAVGPAWAVARHYAHPPLDTLDVHALFAFDPVGRRIAIELGRADTHTLQFAEISLDSGAIELLTPLDRGVIYAAGTRVSVRRSAWQHSTGLLRPRSLCRETAPGNREVDCRKGIIPQGGGVLLGRHPRLHLALATVRDRFVVWDLATDQLTEVVETRARVRWPCFQATRAVLYRLEVGPGPFSHHSLDLVTGESRDLPIGHDLQCAPDVPTQPYAQLIRGRRRLKKPSRVLAPNLPNGLTLSGNLSLAKWSGDGSTVALLFDRPGANLGGFSEAWGLMPPVTIPPTPDVSLSEDGSMLAYALNEGGPGWEIVIRELPSGSLITEFAAGQHHMYWDGAGRLLFIHAHRLIRLNPRSGLREVLFPPNSH